MRGSVLAFPPGGQNLELASGVVESTYAPEAARLGWVETWVLSSLTEVPIRMYVGSTDIAWLEPAEEAVGLLRSRGGDIELTVFEGEGHMMPSDREGG